MVGWASDGASVMIGSKNGVQSKLKVIAPCLISMHDPGHRENLAVSSAYQECIYLKGAVDGTLRNIYMYFCRSSTRKADLKNIQNICDDPALSMKKLYDIRWLARTEAMNAVRRSLTSLLEVFRSDDNDPLAVSIYKYLTSYKFLMVFHAINDIIEDLAVLSKALQKSNFHPYELNHVISKTISHLEELFVSNSIDPLQGGTFIKELMKNLDGHPTMYLGNLIQYNKNHETEARDIIRKFAYEVTQNLRQRFSDSKFNQNWIILDPSKYPNDAKELINFGHQEIDSLLSFYCKSEGENKGILKWNIEEARREYQIFKRFVFEDCKGDSFSTLCKKVLLHYSNIYPFTTELMKIFLCLPLGSVECERGFSQQNLIKTKIRSLLKSPHLDDLLRIRLNGPTAHEFDFKRAISLFCTKVAPKTHIFKK